MRRQTSSGHPICIDCQTSACHSGYGDEGWQPTAEGFCALSLLGDFESAAGMLESGDEDLLPSSLTVFIGDIDLFKPFEERADYVPSDE